MHNLARKKGIFIPLSDHKRFPHINLVSYMPSSEYRHLCIKTLGLPIDHRQNGLALFYRLYQFEMNTKTSPSMPSLRHK